MPAGLSRVRAAWDGLILARNRRIISELLVLSIGPVGEGVRATSLEQPASTAFVVWNRPTHSLRGCEQRRQKLSMPDLRTLLDTVCARIPRLRLLWRCSPLSSRRRAFSLA